ncbi:MAG: hypothetical protein IID49_10090 [Proteobacteria bacterium]|nr:hypothetical protein [Pseudomonadota bacterium]
MIQRLLSRVLSTPDSPTADLYFNNACGDFFDIGGGAGVTRLAPTVFASAGACLVMRHAMRAKRLPGGRRLIYFIDDAVEQGVSDASLPFIYRQKLRLVERAAARRIGRRAAVAVVGSAELARRQTGRIETHLIHPYWSEPIAGLEHFGPLPGGAGWVDIAYLGSIVHRADLAFLWPVIGEVLAAHPRVRFHLAERHRLPTALNRHPRVVRIPGLGWGAYRAGLAGRRFHLALYPLLDTEFNRGRSLNKLIEHGVVGAAALYSRSWSEAWRAGEGGAGLCLRNRRADWRAAIEHLLERPEAMRDLAAGAGALARTLNRAEPQRRLWAELMGVQEHVAA